MDDLISRQAAIDVMLAALDDDWESDYAQDRMCELPSAQRTGRWIVVDEQEPRRYGCSECKRLVWQIENYCPNCGARMEVEKHE